MTWFAWAGFSERLHDAYMWAKQAEAKAERHREQAQIRDWRATERRGVYITVKSESKSQVIDQHEDVKDEFNIDKLAIAVAKSETWNCTKWYWASYNNCFGIRNGNTAPCTKIGINRMCIYETPEQSYEAFKIIWSKWYKTMPNMQLASKRTGKDNANTRLKNVNYHYYNM
jgi:hypothetical protein